MRLISPYEQQYQYANTYPNYFGGAAYTAPPTFKYNGDVQSIQQPQQYYGYYEEPETTQSYGPIFDSRAKLSEQYYYQAGYNPTIIDSNGRSVQLRQNQNDWYYNYYDLYNRQLDQQKQIEKKQEEQLEIVKRLQKIANRSLGIDDEDSTPIDRAKITEEWYKQQQIIQENNDIMNKQMIIQQIDHYAIDSSNPEYRSMAYMNYAAKWDKLYSKREAKYPENYSVYDFFNNGIGEKMYMDMKIDKADEKARQLCNLYNQNNFRNELARLHPSYDPYDGSLCSPNRLTIDDMEVSLPPSLSGTEYQKRRERFFSAISQSMTI